MFKKHQKVIYSKTSSYGAGCIPLGAQGEVLIYTEHPLTSKLLVDFFQYGKAIVPVSSVKKLEDK